MLWQSPILQISLAYTSLYSLIAYLLSLNQRSVAEKTNKKNPKMNKKNIEAPLSSSSLS